jgi:hypothetical protein
MKTQEMRGKDGDRDRGGTVWCPPASHLSPWKRGLSLSPSYKSNETIWAFSLSLSLKFLRPNLQCDWSPVTDRTNIRPTVISFFLSFFGWWLMVALSFIFSYNTGIKVNCTEE